MKIDWEKPGQVVKVGFISDVTTPRFHRGTIDLFVDDKGNYFGCDEKPQFNPITGEKILEVNNDFAESDYSEDEDDFPLPCGHKFYEDGCLDCEYCFCEKCKAGETNRIKCKNCNSGFGAFFENHCKKDPCPEFQNHLSCVKALEKYPPCCPNEKRNMNGGCDNCGDPCI